DVVLEDTVPSNGVGIVIGPIIGPVRSYALDLVLAEDTLNLSTVMDLRIPYRDMLRKRLNAIVRTISYDQIVHRHVGAIDQEACNICGLIDRVDFEPLQSQIVRDAWSRRRATALVRQIAAIGHHKPLHLPACWNAKDGSRVARIARNGKPLCG